MPDTTKRDFAASGSDSTTLSAVYVEGFMSDLVAGLRLGKRAPDAYTSEITSYHNLNTGNEVRALCVRDLLLGCCSRCRDQLNNGPIPDQVPQPEIVHPKSLGPVLS